MNYIIPISINLGAVLFLAWAQLVLLVILGYTPKSCVFTLFFVVLLLHSSQSPFPRPMAHRAAPISVSIALGHTSANAVKATAGGWYIGSSASLTYPLHSHMSSATREGSEYHFKSLWYGSTGARTHDLPIVRQTLYHWAITPAFTTLVW